MDDQSKTSGTMKIERPAAGPEAQAAAGPSDSAQAAGPMDLKALKAMSKGQLRQLCQARGLPTAGKKAELIRILRGEAAGGKAGYVPTKTLCRVCGGPANVVSTESSQGHLTRWIRCQHCSYRWKEVDQVSSARPARK